MAEGSKKKYFASKGGLTKRVARKGPTTTTTTDWQAVRADLLLLSSLRCAGAPLEKRS